MSKYEITNEALENNFPPEIKDQAETLYEQAHSYPEEAVLQLEDLIENYPQTPQLYNYLTLAYSRLGKWDEVDEIIIKNYERHPEYLFAKSNYARLCLRDGNVEQIPAIFNHQFDLKLLYPKRTTFHVSEVIVFFGVMGEYYLKIGQRSAAELCYQALHKIDSRHEQTRVLKKKIYPSIFSKLLHKLPGSTYERIY